MHPSIVPYCAAALTSAAPLAGVQSTERVNVDSNGVQSDGFTSFFASISADGRYVAFAAGATNWGIPNPLLALHVYVRDAQSGTTELVGIDSSGTPGDFGGANPAISGDGRCVAFWSESTNLVPDDTNGIWDVFVHDRVSGATERVTVSSTGEEANGEPFFPRLPSISADGRFVAFQSPATNLVVGDTNGLDDIFVRDRVLATTDRVSVGTGGFEANGSNELPSVSADGRFITYSSDATNLVPGDTNGQRDVFVRDLALGSTERVSVDSDGVQANGNSEWSSISADGRFVAFSSAAANLVPYDTNGLWDVFVHDRVTGATQLVSVGPSGNLGNGDSGLPSISPNGRFVAFVSVANNLVASDANGLGDVFVRDRSLGTTDRVSVDSSGAEGNQESVYPTAISADGRFVLFASDSTNLVPGDTNGYMDVFVRDRGAVALCLPAVYVDCAYAGVENGTFEEPFNTVAEALLAVCSGGEIVLKASTCTATPLAISTPLTLKSAGGPSTIR